VSDCSASGNDAYSKSRFDASHNQVFVETRRKSTACMNETFRANVLAAQSQSKTQAVLWKKAKHRD
jgi:hypothetical protein